MDPSIAILGKVFGYIIVFLIVVISLIGIALAVKEIIHVIIELIKEIRFRYAISEVDGKERAKFYGRIFIVIVIIVLSIFITHAFMNLNL